MIHIQPEAYDQLLIWTALAESENTEVSGMGLVEIPDPKKNELYVTGVFLPKQSVTSTFCEFDSVDYAKIISKLDNPKLLRMWWHLHPFKAYFSDQDKKQIEEWGEEAPDTKFLLAVCFGKGYFSEEDSENVHAEVHIYKPRLVIEEKVTVHKPPRRVTKAQAEYFKSRVKKKVIRKATTTTGTTHTKASTTKEAAGSVGQQITTADLMNQRSRIGKTNTSGLGTANKLGDEFPLPLKGISLTDVDPNDLVCGYTYIWDENRSTARIADIKDKNHLYYADESGELKHFTMPLAKGEKNGRDDESVQPNAGHG